MINDNEEITRSDFAVAFIDNIYTCK